MSRLSESEFVSLCQNVMTGNTVISEPKFFKKVIEILFNPVDPITKSFLKEKSSKLYTFLTTMKANPMRVPLSHAMSETFLGAVRVSTKEISKLLLKHNAKYFTNSGSRDTYCVHHVQDREGLKKEEKRIKVIFVYGDKGVELEFIVPFKTGRKTLYVDVLNNDNRPKGEKTKLDVQNDDRFYHNEFDVDVSNDEILSSKSPVGESLFEYYEIWKTREEAVAIPEEEDLVVEMIPQHLFDELWNAIDD